MNSDEDWNWSKKDMNIFFSSCERWTSVVFERWLTEPSTEPWACIFWALLDLLETLHFLYFSLDFEFQHFGGLRWGSVGSLFLYSVNTIDLSFLLNKKSCPKLKNWSQCLKWKCPNAFLSKSARADRFSEARISNPSSKNTLREFRNFKRRFKTM